MDKIYILKVLYFAGIILWILPAIRQYKSSFFIYFLMLALMDPLILFFYQIANIQISTTIFTLLSYVILLSLLERRTLEKYIIIFLAPVFAILVTSLTTNFLNEETWRFLIILIHFMIFSMILKLYAFKQTREGKLSIFYIVLLFYELTLLFKFVVVTLGFANATGYFIITSFVQIAFGLFFSIVREDNARLIIKL
jgi:hypothetical protein